MFNNDFWKKTNIADESRYKAIKYLILLVFLFLTCRLVQLQIIDYRSYYARAESQTIKQRTVTPIRGVLYDRKGKLIVQNIPTYSVTLTPYDFKKETMPLLIKIIPELDSNNIYTLIKQKEDKKELRLPFKISRDVNENTIFRLVEYLDKLPGIDLVVDSKRVYDFDCNMSHILGYVREITADLLKKYPYYEQGNMIGVSGLEENYEHILRGRNGIHFVLVDQYGRQVDSFANREYDIKPQNGSALNLSIDIELQGLAEKLLTGRRGSVVAMDPNNGEIIICANKPDYDPSLFSGIVPYDIYNKLNTDESNPLLSRATQSRYPPGSTWKMLIALAALQEGIITDKSTIACNGGYTIGGRTWRCHGCGALSVRNALRSSCNTFFCDLGVRLGIDRFEKYGSMFNFGTKTQIDLPFESKGLLPSKVYYDTTFPGTKNLGGRMANLGIGQGELLCTPLQMAAYTATIANGGTYYQPHIVKSVINSATGKVENIHWDSKKIPINPYYFNVVKDGMWSVVNAGGTASGVYISGLNVCGKTGTAQNSKGRDHSWFVCFAPKDNPQIAMCVFVENAGFGSVVAAPIAKRILQKFFGREPESIVIPIEDVEDPEETENIGYDIE
ncbi:MAG: penicillin-binding protein 2 [Bacteroidetes bacterium]|nr:penicillin-binding protein 2 [Bacteroidota bacterium]